MQVKRINQGPFNVDVAESDHIVLSVTIGNAQIGGSVVRLNEQQIGKGEIKDFDIGIGSNLIGKMLTVITNVLDVNPATNKVSITHFIFNGNPPVFSYPPIADGQMDVNNDGDVLSLTATYIFSKK